MYTNNEIKRVCEINEFCRDPFCSAFANPFPKAIITLLTSLTMQREKYIFTKRKVCTVTINDSNYSEKDCSTYSVIYRHT